MCRKRSIILNYKTTLEDTLALQIFCVYCEYCKYLWINLELSSLGHGVLVFSIVEPFSVGNGSIRWWFTNFQVAFCIKEIHSLFMASCQ